jgi:hypothetical protein
METMSKPIFSGEYNFVSAIILAAPIRNQFVLFSYIMLAVKDGTDFRRARARVSHQQKKGVGLKYRLRFTSNSTSQKK